MLWLGFRLGLCESSRLASKVGAGSDVNVENDGPIKMDLPVPAPRGPMSVALLPVADEWTKGLSEGITS
jgi:hypothetical protein